MRMRGASIAACQGITQHVWISIEWIRFMTWSIRDLTWWIRDLTWWIRDLTWWIRDMTWWIRDMTWWIRDMTWWIRHLTRSIRDLTWWIRDLTWWIRHLTWSIWVLLHHWGCRNPLPAIAQSVRHDNKLFRFCFVKPTVYLSYRTAWAGACASSGISSEWLCTLGYAGTPIPTALSVRHDSAFYVLLRKFTLSLNGLQKK